MRPLRCIGRTGLAGLVAGLVIGGVPASAGTLEGFLATARASGARMSYDVPGFLVVERMIDGGGPVAEVSVDSLSAGGYASLPFPGDNGVAFGSLLAAGTGQDAPASYPFYVSARSPGSPSGELSDPSGMYQLMAKAESGAATAEARLARLGNDVSGGSRSTSSVVTDGSTVVATAVSRSEGIIAGGGALKLGLVESRSVTRYTAGDAAAQTAKSIVIEGGSANGTAFTMGPSGIVLGGGSAPVPFGDGLAQLNKGLAPAGVSLGFAQGNEPGSIEAFDVILSHPLPGVAGNVEGRYRLRFGETATSVTAQGLGAPSVVESKPANGPSASPAADPATEPEGLPSAGAAIADGTASLATELAVAPVSVGAALLAPARDALAPAAESTTAGAAEMEVALAPPVTAAAPMLRSVPAASRSIFAPVGSARLLGWVLAGVGFVAVVASWVLRRKGAARWTS